MFNLTLRDSDAGEVALRTVALGMKPMLLIEPKIVGDDEYEFDIDCTDLDIAGIADLCEFLADALRNATTTDATTTEED